MLDVESGPLKLYQIPTTFPCLKTLTLYGIKFSNVTMAQCALLMIWESRNLQTVNITGTYNGAFLPASFPRSQLDSSKNVEAVATSECELLKLGKLMFATKLLKLHRASPVAEVDIYWS
ncbi:hypothetical protein Tco_0598278 [Tanacetum coccineum]